MESNINQLNAEQANNGTIQILGFSWRKSNRSSEIDRHNNSSVPKISRVPKIHNHIEKTIPPINKVDLKQSAIIGYNTRSTNNFDRELNMKGGVYPTKYGWQVRFGKLTKRFKYHEKEKANYFLSGLRYKEYEGTFDIRDYKKAEPLCFSNLVNAFIVSKRHLKAVKKYEQRLRFGVEAWSNRNIKMIGYAEMEILFNDLRDKGKSEY